MCIVDLTERRNTIRIAPITAKIFDIVSVF
jgi:hypothetical protein